MSVEDVKIEKTETIRAQYKNYSFEIDISYADSLDEIIIEWLRRIEKIEKEMVK
ncbi:MAG: hypothetical protein QXU09_03475 [Thermoproteota archaeon]